MSAAPEAATLLELSATQAVARMSRGELSAERYAEVLLARCSTARALNAFISFEPQRVLEDARARDRELRRGVKPGPLFGLPMPIKDSLNTQDYPTTAGTPAMRRFQPARDAPVVAAMRAAGAIVLGKTNLHELSFGWTSNNLSFGAVHNPYDAAHIPGGSSGGTAAAVAARLAPLGISEDTEGSIRVPAALCGICGFRPTTGRYSSAGCVPISQLFDQVGPHARSMVDLILFDSVAANDLRSIEATPLRGVRLGVVRDYFFTDLDPQVERLTTLALERLAAAGAEIVDTQLPGLARLIGRTTNQVQNHDVLIELARYLEENGSALKVEDVLRQASPDIQSVFKAGILPGGDVVTEGEYAAARDQYLPDLRRLYHDYFARTGVAAVVFPATLVPAPRIGEETAVDIGGRSISFKKAIARNTAPGSTAGLPGLVLPAGIAGRLPVALEFDAPSGADRTLLSLGLSLEQALGPIPAPRL